MNTSDPRPAHVLVVDDERNIRLLVVAILQGEGYSVDEASDGAEALAKLDEQAFDLIVLDLNMPVLDGLSVLKQLHEGVPDRRPRAIVLTAYGSISAAVQATRYGASDFLEKPVTPAELRETVAAVLSEPEHAVAAGPADAALPDYAAVLDRVRSALRLTDTATAEALLMRAADLGQHDAAYFNLLGVLYEVRRQWRLARKLYGKALKAEKNYASAQQNMRRIYELYTFGHSAEPIALGDEPGDAWFARLTSRKGESA